MKPTTTEVQQLYIAYFNRPAEPEGLQYWTSVDATQDSIAGTFATSHEFTQRYAGMSNKEMVKALYHNLFGRAGDADGVTYWSGLLDSGAVKPEHVALTLLRGAHGGDSAVLANKTALAQEWSAGAKVLQPYAAARDIAAISALWLEQVTDAASLQNTRTALTKYLANPGTSSTMVSGQAQGMGYLRDATVFVDSNGNGMLDITEQSTKTDANGHFLLASSGMVDFPQSRPSWDQHIVVTGGYDLATGRAHNGTLSLTFTEQHSGSYPATTLVRATASAMTTLRDALVRTGTGATNAADATSAADAVLAKAFGLKITPGTDSLSTAFDADNGARAAPLSITALHAEIDAIAEVVARTLQMLSARLPADGIRYEAPKLSLDVAMRAAYDGMAAVLAAAKGGVALEHGATALQVLNAAAALLLKTDGAIVTSPATLSAATLDAFQQIMGATVTLARAGISDSADTYATLAHITQVRAMLDQVADTLPRAMAENKAAALLPQWTDAAIKAKVAAIDVGDIDPYSQNDSAAIAQANGTPPALDKLAVEQVYIALLNRPAAPDALQKWVEKGDATALAAALTAELSALPGWQGKGSDAQVVNTLYLNLFGRPADASGLLYWSGVLRDQKIDLATLAQHLVEGANGSDAVTVRNKVVGALEYTSALTTPALADAYQGNPIGGNYWMAGITDNATLKSALDLLPDFLISNGPIIFIGLQDPAPL